MGEQLPGVGGERLQQLELRERGVLEFIDQDVPEVQPRAQPEVGRRAALLLPVPSRYVSFESRPSGIRFRPVRETFC